MDKITKPSITRLARRAGIKSLSEECHDTIKNLIGMELSNIIKNVIVINTHNQTKTIMPKDVYDTLHLMNYNIAKSNDLTTTTCQK
jgi:histone H3/H4